MLVAVIVLGHWMTTQQSHQPTSVTIHGPHSIVPPNQVLLNVHFQKHPQTLPSPPFWVCGVHASTCRYMCICVHVEARGQLRLMSLRCHPSYFVRRDLSLAGYSPSRLHWMASESQGSTCLHFPSAEIANVSACQPLVKAIAPLSPFLFLTFTLMSVPSAFWYLTFCLLLASI